jgi:hypothetical protein
MYPSLCMPSNLSGTLNLAVVRGWWRLIRMAALESIILRSRFQCGAENCAYFLEFYDLSRLLRLERNGFNDQPCGGEIE